jgi:hypothetical protein
MSVYDPKAPILRLSSEAAVYLAEIEKRRRVVLAQVRRLPIAVLLWGPAPNTKSKAAETRVLLRDELIRAGHIAEFSEDLVDAASRVSLPVQQLAHVEAADLVFSIPDSPGSIAEIHDFARIPGLSHKIITFLNRDWNDGYANRSLIELESSVTCAIEPYDPDSLPGCVIDRATELVNRLQEIHFFRGRRV